MFCLCTNHMLLVTFIWSFLSPMGCPVSSWAWSFLVSTGSCYMLQGWSMSWRKRFALAFPKTKLIQKQKTSTSEGIHKICSYVQDITLHLSENPKQIISLPGPFPSSLSIEIEQHKSSIYTSIIIFPELSKGVVWVLTAVKIMVATSENKKLKFFRQRLRVFWAAIYLGNQHAGETPGDFFFFER